MLPSFHSYDRIDADPSINDRGWSTIIRHSYSVCVIYVFYTLGVLPNFHSYDTIDTDPSINDEGWTVLLSDAFKVYV